MTNCRVAIYLIVSHQVLPSFILKIFVLLEASITISFSSAIAILSQQLHRYCSSNLTIKHGICPYFQHT